MRSRFVSIEWLESLAARAIAGGYATVRTWRLDDDPRFAGRPRRQVELHLSADCEHPVYCELFSRTPARHGDKRPPISVIIKSRCRKCEECRDFRRRFWSAGAVTEFQRAPRTIFGTLTLRPEEDVRIDAEARVWLLARGVDFDKLSDEDKFRTRVKFGGKLVTDWLKRLRQGAADRPKPALRYLAVAEAHKGARPGSEKRGRPHWHILLHEQDLSRPLVLDGEWSGRSDKYGNPTVSDEAFLKAQWRAGFSSFSHCRTPQAASYLCKYLTKAECAVRIRASYRYGLEAEASAL